MHKEQVPSVRGERLFKNLGDFSDNELKGKVAVITGAAGGVGKATVKRLASEGCKVVFIGRNRKSLDKVAEVIQEKKNVLAIKADLTREGEVISASRANDIQI